MITRLAKNDIDLTLADYDNRNCFDVARDNKNNNLVEILENIKKWQHFLVHIIVKSGPILNLNPYFNHFTVIDFEKV